MVRGKRGQLMGIYLAFATVLFCGIVLGMFIRANTVLDAAVISPVPVLELSDAKIAFENEEYLVLREVYCNNRELDKMKSRFCLKFNSLDSSFLTDDSRPVDSGLNLNNLCEGIYEFSSEGEGVLVSRKGLVKKKFLRGDGSTRGFDMNLEFNLEKEYLLTPDDCS